MKSSKIFWYWFPVVVYAGLIWYISSLTLVWQPGSVPAISDKIKHAAEYFIFVVLLYRAVHNTISRKYAYLIAISMAIVYGIIDEIHQYFVPGRFFSYLDMLANTVGTLLILLKMLWKKQVSTP